MANAVYKINCNPSLGFLLAAFLGYGDFSLIVYKNKIIHAEHIALVKGKINPKK